MKALYRGVYHHTFEVSIICIANHLLVFVSGFGCGDLFLGEPFIFPGRFVQRPRHIVFWHEFMVDPFHNC